MPFREASCKSQNPGPRQQARHEIAPLKVGEIPRVFQTDPKDAGLLRGFHRVRQNTAAEIPPTWTGRGRTISEDRGSELHPSATGPFSASQCAIALAALRVSIIIPATEKNMAVLRNVFVFMVIGLPALNLNQMRVRAVMLDIVAHKCNT